MMMGITYSYKNHHTRKHVRVVSVICTDNCHHTCKHGFFRHSLHNSGFHLIRTVILSWHLILNYIRTNLSFYSHTSNIKRLFYPIYALQILDTQNQKPQQISHSKLYF
ncbi:hypothetical protein LX69_02903 [Breznakibacter xylanolyticus]|uniref:Uncharacterized protein n=1 Tax=Breznakibacter xylanolyticus TaxID=990 RepID=A0A2W7NLZ4_9BACT|nr:hypothetical protein LX69_02903 [Breznakibacter xylanolyticus]